MKADHEYNNGNYPFSNFTTVPHIGAFRREMNVTKGKGEFFRDGQKLVMAATNGNGSPSLLSNDSNMSFAVGINGSRGKSFLNGEVYGLVFAKTQRFCSSSFRRVSLISGELETYQVVIHLSRLDLVLAVHNKSIS